MIFNLTKDHQFTTKIIVNNNKIIILFFSNYDRPIAPYSRGKKQKLPILAKWGRGGTPLLVKDQYISKAKDLILN